MAEKIKIAKFIAISCILHQQFNLVGAITWKSTLLKFGMHVPNKQFLEKLDNG